MKKIMFLIFILAILLISGCASPTYTKDNSQETSNQQTNTQEEIEPKEKEITYISLLWPISKNWDSDPEVDGIEIDLTPYTKNDEMVETEGIVEVKLWEYTCTDYSEMLEMCIEKDCVKSEDALLEEWNVPLKKEDFDFMGATIRAEYEKYDPTEDERNYPQGCILVTLKAQDKEFSAEEDSVSLK
ncbi:hypothetical protein JW949_03615 [Candidatus Woesearchaeota archaeon]|nr:hypothetical protein [Candidatus Woesearchaeota archaeon]